MESAFSRVQIRRAEILQEHIANAATESNLLQVEWANKGPLLWTVDQQSVPLTGAQVFNVPPNTVMITDAWVSSPQSEGSGTYSDRIIAPFSRSEWAATPNKTQAGSVTSFWFDRTISPTITIWPVDDGSQGNVLNYFRFSQIQDAATAGAATPQTPYLWFDAYVAGLSYRLARIYKPELESVRAADAKTAYDVAANQGVENVALFIAPTTSSYWR
jgi:hypothetical protein